MFLYLKYSYLSRGKLDQHDYDSYNQHVDGVRDILCFLHGVVENWTPEVEALWDEQVRYLQENIAVSYNVKADIILDGWNTHSFGYEES
jgi:hypothetical protein